MSFSASTRRCTSSSHENSRVARFVRTYSNGNLTQPEGVAVDPGN